MTINTDIKALREQAKTAKACGGMFAISGEQALYLLDQLEAERQHTNKFKFVFDEWVSKTEWVQSCVRFPFFTVGMHRADAMTQYIRHLEHQWEHRAPTQWAYDQACAALHAQRERAEKAEASVGVLEGIIARKEFDSQKAEPVTMDALRDAVAEMSGGLPLEWREGTAKGHHAVPFINFNSLHRIVTKFTTPLNPVESCD